jgi:hypothetical protein
MKKIKNCYVWCEDGTFTNDGKVIDYTSWYLNVNGIDINIKLDKMQLKLIKQMKDFWQFDEIDGIEVE